MRHYYPLGVDSNGSDSVSMVFVDVVKPMRNATVHLPQEAIRTTELRRRNISFPCANRDFPPMRLASASASASARARTRLLATHFCRGDEHRHEAFSFRPMIIARGRLE